MTKISRLTLFVFLALFGLLMVFDAWTLLARGYETTVSWTLYVWAQQWPIVPFLAGVLIGHLWFPNRAANKPSTYPPFQSKIPIEKMVDAERKANKAWSE